MKRNSFIEGAFIATVAIIITKIIGLLYVIPFYQIIGEKGGALYGYAYNIYNLFLIISTAGIPLAISKIISEYEALHLYKSKERVFSLTKKIIIPFSIICFAIVFIFAPFIANVIIGDMKGGNTIDDIALSIRIVSFALLVIPILSISRGYLQGHKYITVPSLSQVIEQLVRVSFILLGSFLAIKVFHLSLNSAVNIAVFGATVGGLFALVYLTRKMSLFRKSHVDNGTNNSEIVVSDKEIIKKIIFYSLPFIIINVADNIYSFIDMTLIIRTLNHLNFPASDIESISSIFTTWGYKLQMIVTAAATGMVISLIPNISGHHAKGEFKEINVKLNKAIQMLFLFILPLTMALSFLAKPVWIIFYGVSEFGPTVFSYLIIIAFFSSFYIVSNSFLQSIGKYKLLFFSVILGLVINAGLDVPLMLLFNHLELPVYYGAITATVIGYSFSILVSFIKVGKDYKFNYLSALKALPKSILTVLLMGITTLILNKVLILEPTKIMQLVFIAINGLIYAGIFLIVNGKELNELLGKDFFNKLKSKLKKK